MMTEKTIEDMICSYRQYETEMSIIRDCSGLLSEDEMLDNKRYMLLKQRLTLMNHWLAYLPADERLVIRHHLIEGDTWNEILDMCVKENIVSIGSDRRTLQRMKRRALDRLYALMADAAEQFIDHLLPDVDETESGKLSS